MERDLLHSFAHLEKDHWWFVGRRRIVEAELTRMALPEQADIVEIGCGTGGNLAMLSRHGSLEAVELEDEARAMAEGLGICPVAPGHLPDGLPLQERRYDLIVLLDVLEHVEEHEAAVARLSEHLKPNGRILLTVPALPSLWSEHDARNHHFRRYTKASMLSLMKGAGLAVERCSYFNALLLPLALFERLIVQRLSKEYRSPAIPRKFANGMLGRVFSFEARWLALGSFPIGLSLFCLAKTAEER